MHEERTTRSYRIFSKLLWAKRHARKHGIFSWGNSHTRVCAHSSDIGERGRALLLPYFYALLRQPSGECGSSDEDESAFDEIGLFLSISNKIRTSAGRMRLFNRKPDRWSSEPSYVTNIPQLLGTRTQWKRNTSMDDASLLRLTQRNLRWRNNFADS